VIVKTKTALLLSFIYISGGLRAQTLDMLMMGLVSNHNLVFGKENLFSKPLEPNEWYRYLDAVDHFVGCNARGDTQLLGAQMSIFTINDTMINNIKLAYNTVVGPYGQYQESVVHDVLTAFQDSIIELQSVQIALEQERFFFTSKKEVCQLLAKLAFFVEVTTQKAARDLSKLIAQNVEAEEFNEYL
jgi:hypothetical protein